MGYCPASRRLAAAAQGRLPWVLTGVPLVVVAPVVGTRWPAVRSLGGTLVMSLLLGTADAQRARGIGAALTVACGGAACSVAAGAAARDAALIFGSRAVTMAMDGDSPSAVAAARGDFLPGASLGPLAMSAADPDQRRELT